MSGGEMAETRQIAVIYAADVVGFALVAALAFTGRDAEAREALQRHLAPHSIAPFKTIATWKAHDKILSADPRIVEMNERACVGPRKAETPEW
jgi:hypothetical protein